MSATTSSRPIIWTPRLRPLEEDEQVYLQEPFKTYLTTAASTRSQASSQWVQLLATLDTPTWEDFASDWLLFCLGGDISSREVGWRLILDVFFLRFSKCGAEADSQAYNLLGAAQAQKTFQAYGPVPADFSWFDDLDRRELVAADGEPGELTDNHASEPTLYDDVESDDSDESDDPMDGTYIESPKSSQAPPMPNYVQSHAALCPPTLPKTTPFTEQPPMLPAKWLTNFRVFFYPKVRPEPEFRRSKKDVLDDYCQMRDLPKCVYNLPEFKQALKVSGLEEALLSFCEAGNLIETSHPDVELSFCFHNWKTSYGEVLCKWIPPTISEEELERRRPKADRNYKFSPEEALGLLQFISDHREMHPWIYNPMAAYFLLSLDCFHFYSNTWLAQCLRKLNYLRIEGWNELKVYRTIMQLPLLLNADSTESLKFLKGLNDRKLAVVLHETWAHRSLLRQVKEQVWRPPIPGVTPLPPLVSEPVLISPPSVSDVGDSDSDTAEDPAPQSSSSQSQKSKGAKRNAKKRLRQAQERKKEQKRVNKEERDVLGEDEPECLLCKDLKMEERCIRLMPVLEQANVEDLIGVALTCAPDGDRLQPLPVKQDKSTVNNLEPQYKNPEKLGWEWVRPREATLKRCRKDITRFIFTDKAGTEDMVGGVRFDAMAPETLERLIDNHRRVQVRAIRRRTAMQAWAHGTMTAAGNRQPMGGVKGDTYGPYACHSGDTPDDIKALFRHAVDAEVLIEIGTTIIPTLRSDVKTLTDAADEIRLGRHGVNTYYCDNYLGALHPDNDRGVDDLKNNRWGKNCRGASMDAIYTDL
ncbi:hypothetical protein C8R44DRAFT_867470 [Mycena epipterygia]|nr:hypothetical protein C8R44DRAFT_867470 [Mycena epipterygia]